MALLDYNPPSHRPRPLLRRPRSPPNTRHPAPLPPRRLLARHAHRRARGGAAHHRLYPRTLRAVEEEGPCRGDRFWVLGN